VHLSPHEQVRLLLSYAAELARRRQAHGRRLDGTGKDAVRLPLPGGWVTTAWGTELHRVLRAAEALDPRAGDRVPA
jgi:hypothetical protein